MNKRNARHDLAICRARCAQGRFWIKSHGLTTSPLRVCLQDCYQKQHHSLHTHAAMFPNPGTVRTDGPCSEQSFQQGHPMAISTHTKRTCPLNQHNQSAAGSCQPTRPLGPEGTDPHVERRESTVNALPACFTGITVLGKPEKLSLPAMLERGSF